MHNQNVTLLYACIMQGELSMITSVHFTEMYLNSKHIICVMGPQ